MVPPTPAPTAASLQPLSRRRASSAVSASAAALADALERAPSALAPSLLSRSSRPGTGMGGRAASLSFLDGGDACGRVQDEADRLPASTLGFTSTLYLITKRSELRSTLLRTSERADTFFGTPVPKTIPLPRTQFVMPKYANAWRTMDHMRDRSLEDPDPRAHGAPLRRPGSRAASSCASAARVLA
eukprot:TRINITY_DN8274_c0_g1_i3.p1 TRINITY_DN8274_c0_g1~~TRINITY_DN8274_c0_g1_i3.p1  ORF type:complete len:217 (-),score=30.60 TRINITY_DN8274_c0_g1_i3:165-722(-)